MGRLCGCYSARYSRYGKHRVSDNDTPVGSGRASFRFCIPKSSLRGLGFPSLALIREEYRRISLNILRNRTTRRNSIDYNTCNFRHERMLSLSIRLIMEENYAYPRTQHRVLRKSRVYVVSSVRAPANQYMRDAYAQSRFCAHFPHVAPVMRIT